MSTPWSSLSGAPFLTVSPKGIKNGQSTITNNGCNYGPDTSGTTTSGIQEALNAIATTGGLLFCEQGNYTITASLIQTGSDQTVFFAPGCTISFGSGASLSSQGTTGKVVYSFVILVGANNNSSNMQNYSNCRWYGNGCIIQQNGLSGPNTTNTIFINNWDLRLQHSPSAFPIHRSRQVRDQPGAKQSGLHWRQ